MLAAAALLFAAGCSDSSDDDTISASDLAGTTWEYRETLTEASSGTPFGTGITTLEFYSDGKVVHSGFEYKDDGTLLYSESNTYTYSVSGSTVTLYDEDGNVFRELTYSSGNLSYTIEDDGESFTCIYTKVS